MSARPANADDWEVDLAFGLVTYRPQRVSFAVARRRGRINPKRITERHLIAMYVGDPLPAVELAQLRRLAAMRYLEALGRAIDIATVRCAGAA